MFEINGVIHLMDSGSKPMSGDILCFELYSERAVGKPISPETAKRLRSLLWRI